MGDEEEYDVRAVEARLARMQAARHMRTGGSKTQHQAPQQAPLMHNVGCENGQPHQFVGDFELSELDSSASDSEDCGSVSTSSASDDEGQMLQKQQNKGVKLSLKDSLDLSMSMSVAWPVEAERAPKECCGKHHGAKKIVSTRHNDAVMKPKGNSDQMMGDREDLFAGKLIQRRRELERQATRETEQATRDPAPRNETQPKRLLGSALEPNDRSAASERMANAEPEKELKPTGRVVHRDQDPRAHSRFPHAEKSLAQPRAHLPVQSPEMPHKDPARAQPPPVMRPDDKLSAVVVDNGLRRASPAGNLARPVASAAASKSLVAASAVPATHRSQTTQRAKDTIVQALTRTNPSTVPPTKKAVADTVSQTTATAASAGSTATTAAANPTTKPGYARGGGSNQPQAAAPVPKLAVPALAASNNEPQQGPDELMDGLLTAEELQLRESLERLSSRLHSLATARETQARTANDAAIGGTNAGRQQPQHYASVDDEKRGFDVDKAVRLASYGGGAHTRLHQAASLMFRVSNAKRSELSSGVHKARVRPGATVVHDAGVTPAAEGGKHKVVVKKDLAHLLF